MINEYFTINYSGTDFSRKLKDFGTSSVSIELQLGEYIYIGYEKPFNQIFVELEEVNTSGGLLSAEYFDGSAWQPLNSLIDETEDFSKSGFLFFDKPSSWAEGEVESVSKFYIRLSTTVSHSVGVLVQGIGILLSNDLDLEGIRSNIVSKHNNGESWVLKHEAARKAIVDELRRKGNRVVTNDDKNNPLVTEGKKFKDLTEFDLLEPEQLRQASMYKTLSMIYLDELSDEEGDKYERQGMRYENSFYQALNVFALAIDFDNDGLADDNESVLAYNTDLIFR
jgi:hypothetical protein